MTTDTYCCAFLVALMVTACGGTYELRSASEVPAAQGEVKTKNDDGNTRIKLSIQHLAPAEKVDADASTYVVWVKPRTGDVSRHQNVGVLEIDKNLKGNLETTTPHESFDLSVTPERSGDVTEPSGRPVLTARVD